MVKFWKFSHFGLQCVKIIEKIIHTTGSRNYVVLPTAHLVGQCYLLNSTAKGIKRYEIIHNSKISHYWVLKSTPMLLFMKPWVWQCEWRLKTSATNALTNNFMALDSLASGILSPYRWQEILVIQIRHNPRKFGYIKLNLGTIASVVFFHKFVYIYNMTYKIQPIRFSYPWLSSLFFFTYWSHEQVK